MTLRVAGIVQDSIVDGPGLRLAIFAQGCPHACPGCHNPHTWPEEGGTLREAGELATLALQNPLCQGVTLSGGEPFQQAEACAELARLVREGGKDVWVYTGYTMEELQQADRMDWNALIAQADALVDGRYMQALRTLGVPFVGSSNQRIWRRGAEGLRWDGEDGEE